MAKKTKRDGFYRRQLKRVLAQMGVKFNDNATKYAMWLAHFLGVVNLLYKVAQKAVFWTSQNITIGGKDD